MPLSDGARAAIDEIVAANSEYGNPGVNRYRLAAGLAAFHDGAGGDAFYSGTVTVADVDARTVSVLVGATTVAGVPCQDWYYPEVDDVVRLSGSGDETWCWGTFGTGTFTLSRIVGTDPTGL